MRKLLLIFIALTTVVAIYFLLRYSGLVEKWYLGQTQEVEGMITASGRYHQSAGYYPLLVWYHYPVGDTLYEGTQLLDHNTAHIAAGHPVKVVYSIEHPERHRLRW